MTAAIGAGQNKVYFSEVKYIQLGNNCPARVILEKCKRLRLEEEMSRRQGGFRQYVRENDSFCAQ